VAIFIFKLFNIKTYEIQWILGNSDNCPGFGFYIYNMHIHFLKQMLFLYTWGIKQIIPTNRYEDGGTSILLSRDRADIDVYSTQPFVWFTCFDHRLLSREPDDNHLWSKPVNQINFILHSRDVLVICFITLSCICGSRPYWIPFGIHLWESTLLLTLRCWCPILLRIIPEIGYHWPW
jgi:hypothetical protein